MKKIAFIVSLLFTTKTYAHVGYVIEQNDFTANLGSDTSYLLSPLSNPKNIALIFGTIVGVCVLYFLAYKLKKVREFVIVIRARLDTYYEYIAWILRLSLGIAFVGASTAHVLISPLMKISSFGAVQLVIGFMLLAGFLVVPASLIGILLYVYAVTHNAYIIGNGEIVFALIALIILGSARPGADDVLGIPQIKTPSLISYVPFLLRLGIGGAMTYLALYEKILNPHVSALVVEQYNLTSVIGVSAAMWVFAVGIIELIVGIFLLIGLQTRLVSIVAFVVLCTTFFFFKEDVYSHITLFGVLSVLMITGAGKVSADFLIKKK